MKVITELIDYFIERGALSWEQLGQLARLGFYRLPDSYDEEPVCYPDEDDGEDEDDTPPVRRVKRKAGIPGRTGNLTADSLNSWLKTSIAGSAGSLHGMTALVQKIDPQATLETTPMILRNVPDGELVEALRHSIATRDPAIDQLWDAMSVRGYREIEGGLGTVAQAYRAILRSDEHIERGKHAWLLKQAYVRWIYNLIRGQRRLITMCGGLNREDPELLRRAIGRDYHRTASLASLIVHNAPRRKPAVRLELEGHAGSVRSLAMTQDGAFLVSGGEDGTVRSWDLGGGSQTTLIRRSAPVECVAVSGRMVAAGDRQGAITVCPIDGSPEISSWAANPDGIRAIAFSPDGGILAAGNVRGFVHLWNPITRGLLAVFGGHAQKVIKLACSHGSEYLASTDGTKVILWAGDLGRALLEIPAQGAPRGIAFHPNDRRLAVCCEGTLSTWTVPDGEQQDVRGDLKECLSIAWSPRGDSIAIGTQKGILVFDEHLNPAAELTCRQPIVFLDFASSGSIVAVAESGISFVWEPLPGGGRFDRIESNFGSTSASYSRHRDLLAVATYTGWIRIWEISESPRWVGTLPRTGPAVAAMAFDPEGKSLYVACRDGEISAWDLETKTECPIVKDEEFPVQCLDFMGEGRLIAGGAGPGEIGVVRSVDTANGSVVRRQCGSPGGILALVFHPRESILLSAGEKGLIYVWDRAVKSCVAIMSGPSQVRCLQWRPQGDLVAAAAGSDAWRHTHPRRRRGRHNRNRRPHQIRLYRLHRSTQRPVSRPHRRHHNPNHRPRQRQYNPNRRPLHCRWRLLHRPRRQRHNPNRSHHNGRRNLLRRRYLRHRG